MNDITRRSYVGLLGGIGITSIGAGCIGDDDDNGDDVPDDVSPRIHDFLNSARGYDNSIVDARGDDVVEIDVGAGSGGLEFAPVAVRIDVDTTVIWTWTGEGGLHDVASVGGSDFSFTSHRTRDAGETFEYTFDDGGVALYECRPHRTQAMFGAIEVLFEDDMVEIDNG